MPGQAMRGSQFVRAVTLLAELGDLTRFGSARQLMGYLDLVPGISLQGGPAARQDKRHRLEERAQARCSSVAAGNE